MTTEVELLLRVSGTTIVVLLIISLITALASNELPKNHQFFSSVSYIWKLCLYVIVSIMIIWIVYGILDFIWTADSETFNNK